MLRINTIKAQQIGRRLSIVINYTIWSQIFKKVIFKASMQQKMLEQFLTNRYLFHNVYQFNIGIIIIKQPVYPQQIEINIFPCLLNHGKKIFRENYQQYIFVFYLIIKYQKQLRVKVINFPKKQFFKLQSKYEKKYIQIYQSQSPIRQNWFFSDLILFPCRSVVNKYYLFLCSNTRNRLQEYLAMRSSQKISQVKKKSSTSSQNHGIDRSTHSNMGRKVQQINIKQTKEQEVPNKEQTRLSDKGSSQPYNQNPTKLDPMDQISKINKNKSDIKLPKRKTLTQDNQQEGSQKKFDKQKLQNMLKNRPIKLSNSSSGFNSNTSQSEASVKFDIKANNQKDIQFYRQLQQKVLKLKNKNKRKNDYIKHQKKDKKQSGYSNVSVFQSDKSPIVNCLGSDVSVVEPTPQNRSSITNSNFTLEVDKSFYGIGQNQTRQQIQKIKKQIQALKRQLQQQKQTRRNYEKHIYQQDIKKTQLEQQQNKKITDLLEEQKKYKDKILSLEQLIEQNIKQIEKKNLQIQRLNENNNQIRVEIQKLCADNQIQADILQDKARQCEDLNKKITMLENTVQGLQLNIKKFLNRVKNPIRRPSSNSPPIQTIDNKQNKQEIQEIKIVQQEIKNVQQQIKTDQLDNIEFVKQDSINFGEKSERQSPINQDRNFGSPEISKRENEIQDSARFSTPQQVTPTKQQDPSLKESTQLQRSKINQMQQQFQRAKIQKQKLRLQKQKLKQSHEDLSKQVMNLQQQNKRKQSLQDLVIGQNNQLKTKLQVENKRNQQLQKQIQSLKQNLQTLKRQGQQNIMIMTELKQKQKNQQISKKIQEIIDKYQKFKQRQQQILQLQKKLQLFEAQNVSYIKFNDQLQKQIESQKKLNYQYELVMDKQKIQLDKYQRTNDNLRDQNQSLRNKVQILQFQKFDNGQRIRRMQEQLQALNNITLGVNQQIIRCNVIMKSKQIQILMNVDQDQNITKQLEYQQKISALQQQLQQLKQKQQFKVDLIQLHNKNIIQLNQRIQNIQNILPENQSEKSSKGGQPYQQQNQRLHAEVQKMQNQVQKINQKLNQVQNILEQKQQLVQQQLQQIKTLKQKIQKYNQIQSMDKEAQMLKLLDKIKSLQSQLKKKNQQIKMFQRDQNDLINNLIQNDGLKKQINNYTNKLAEKDYMIEKLQQNISLFKRQQQINQKQKDDQKQKLYQQLQRLKNQDHLKIQYQLAQKNHHIQYLQEANQKFRQLHLQLKQQEDQSTAFLVQKDRIIEQLKAKINKIQSQYQQYKQHTKQKEYQIQSLKGLIVQSQDNLAENLILIQNLQNQMQKTTQQHVNRQMNAFSHYVSNMQGLYNRIHQQRLKQQQMMRNQIEIYKIKQQEWQNNDVSKQHIDQLERKNGQIQHQVKEMQKIIDKFQDQILSLGIQRQQTNQKNLSILQDKIKILEERDTYLKQCLQNIKILQDKLVRLQANRNQQDIISFKVKLQQLQKQNQEFKDLEEQYKLVCKLNCQLDQRVINMEKQIQQLTKRLNERNIQTQSQVVSRFKSRLQQLMGQNEKIRTQLQIIQSVNSHYKQIISAQQKQLQSLKKQNNNENPERLSKLQNQNQRLKQQNRLISLLKDTNSSNQSKIQQLQKQVLKNNEQIQKLKLKTINLDDKNQQILANDKFTKEFKQKIQQNYLKLLSLEGKNDVLQTFQDQPDLELKLIYIYKQNQRLNRQNIILKEIILSLQQKNSVLYNYKDKKSQTYQNLIEVQLKLIKIQKQNQQLYEIVRNYQRIVKKKSSFQQCILDNSQQMQNIKYINNQLQQQQSKLNLQKDSKKMLNKNVEMQNINKGLQLKLRQVLKQNQELKKNCLQIKTYIDTCQFYKKFIDTKMQQIQTQQQQRKRVQKVHKEQIQRLLKQKEEMIQSQKKKQIEKNKQIQELNQKIQQLNRIKQIENKCLQLSRQSIQKDKMIKEIKEKSRQLSEQSVQKDKMIKEIKEKSQQLIKQIEIKQLIIQDLTQKVKLNIDPNNELLQFSIQLESKLKQIQNQHKQLLKSLHDSYHDSYSLLQSQLAKNKQQISAKDQQIKQLKSKYYEMFQNNDRKQKSQKQHIKIIEQLQNINKNKDQIIKKLNTQLLRVQSTYSLALDDTMQFDKILMQANKQKQEYQQKNKNLQKINSQLSKQISHKDNQIQELMKKNKQLALKNGRVTQLQSQQCLQCLRLKNMLQQTKRNNQIELSKRQQQMKKNNGINEYSLKRIQDLNKNKNDELESKIIELQKEITSKDRYITQHNTQLQTLRQQIQKYKQFFLANIPKQNEASLDIECFSQELPYNALSKLLDKHYKNKITDYNAQLFALVNKFVVHLAQIGLIKNNKMFLEQAFTFCDLLWQYAEINQQKNAKKYVFQSPQVNKTPKKSQRYQNRQRQLKATKSLQVNFDKFIENQIGNKQQKPKSVIMSQDFSDAFSHQQDQDRLKYKKGPDSIHQLQKQKVDRSKVSGSFAGSTHSMMEQIQAQTQYKKDMRDLKMKAKKQKRRVQ